MRVVRELTGAPAASLTAETPLMEAGVDSLAATELSSRLRALSGVALSPTLVFEHPTPRAIAAHLLERVGGALPVPQAVPIAAMSAPSGALATRGHVGAWPGGCARLRVEVPGRGPAAAKRLPRGCPAVGMRLPSRSAVMFLALL